jgi:hypothetical protein
MAKFGSTLVWALLLVVVALAAGIGIARYGDRVPWLADLMGGPTQTTETTVLGIRRLNELATAEMSAQVVVTEQKDVRIFSQPLPRFLTGQEVLLIAKGEVEAGIDLDEVRGDDVRVDGKKVTIDLPKARILDTSLDEDKTKLYDWNRGVLIKGDYALVEEARQDAVDEIERTAREDDLVDKAQRNAEDGIRGFLTSLGYKKIAFKEPR